MIYIITHKKAETPVLKGYKPLLVGAVNHPELKQYYLSDDSGDNISAKNSSYCELTGLYWMWKNCTDHFIGMVHYRRFFANNFLLYHDWGLVINPAQVKICSEEELKAVLLESKTDLIVKTSPKWRNTNWKLFSTTVGDKNMLYLFQAVHNTAPEYLDSFIAYKTKKSHINCNMFFGKKEVIDRYCEWLFPILREADELFYQSTGEYYQHRELGYFGEYLFGVWLDAAKVPYKIQKVINLDLIAPIVKIPQEYYKHLLRRIDRN